MIDFLLPYCLLIRHLKTEMVFVFTSLFKSASPAKDSLGTTSALQLVISALAPAPRWQNVRHREVYIFNYSGMPLCISTCKLTNHSSKPAPSSTHMLHTHTFQAPSLTSWGWHVEGCWQVRMTPLYRWNADVQAEEWTKFSIADVWKNLVFASRNQQSFAVLGVCQWAQPLSRVCAPCCELLTPC